ncbi:MULTISPECIES: class I SAM-dependent methyltransferase [unclassified Bosea (in: a-proteobacteria)]|uniref:class I SAM-dependent methyltransferase n=1 Tax=unclassified Bosea (in: a-proteobacteria) TaxID=2653178 RepID=UPI000954FBA6|nr:MULTISPECIES: class I SAM-dependent methyltransferase [unclassified Bosea (in: a-proteobacteria)]TAJ32690.1 MAG: class I SAM-dependent methyltransferase [Bosea sp. (in: a-proteobacteria)]SIQ36175.1 phosphatidylethanolamine/phosphatidyl-N-methylethanolamine N-methyltransferase [Bosea sp. TND4EK4]
MPVTYDLDSQKRVYATWAKFYDKIYQRMLARPQREAVAAACACGPEILEIGVGTGLTLAYFDPGSRVVGADLSLDMLRVAQRKVTGQKLAHVRGLTVMDACRLGFAAERFDAVTAQFVITLVPKPEQALAEMDRVLKPGGEIIISSRLVDDGGLLAPFWAAVAPLAKAVGWSSDFKVSRLTNWAAASGRYETVHVGRGYFKVVRLRKLASLAS